MNREIEIAALEALVATLQAENKLLRESLDVIRESRQLKTMGQLFREEEERLVRQYEKERFAR